jgi:hypothetical protein
MKLGEERGLFAKYGTNWCRYCGQPAKPAAMIELFKGFYLHEACLQEWKAEKTKDTEAAAHG